MDQDQGVGRQVKKLREERGWSQTRLAVEADMSVSGISMIENGHRNLSTATLAKLAAALGVEVRDLFPLAQPPLDLIGHSVEEQAGVTDALANSVGLLSNKLRDELGATAGADDLFLLSLQASFAYIGALQVAEGVASVTDAAEDNEAALAAKELLGSALAELYETSERIDQAMAAAESFEELPEGVAWLAEERRRRAG
jgi:DNA-binding XRE family transcriptional regulator